MECATRGQRASPFRTHGPLDHEGALITLASSCDSISTGTFGLHPTPSQVESLDRFSWEPRSRESSLADLWDFDYQSGGGMMLRSPARKAAVAGPRAHLRPVLSATLPFGGGGQRLQAPASEPRKTVLGDKLAAIELLASQQAAAALLQPHSTEGIVTVSQLLTPGTPVGLVAAKENSNTLALTSPTAEGKASLITNSTVHVFVEAPISSSLRLTAAPYMRQSFSTTALDTLAEVWQEGQGTVTSTLDYPPIEEVWPNGDACMAPVTPLAYRPPPLLTPDTPLTGPVLGSATQPVLTLPPAAAAAVAGWQWQDILPAKAQQETVPKDGEEQETDDAAGQHSA